jgi:Resolvase, N terminal domain
MNEQTKRVVIYGRVSTEGQSVQMQITELREYVVRRGWHCPSRSARDRQASKSGQGWLSRRRQPYCFFRSGTGRSVLSKSDYLLPIGQIARPWPGLGLPVENFYPVFC